MHTLDFLVQPQLAPAVSLAHDRHFMQAATRASRTNIGILRVFDVAGEVLSIGRYHIVPGTPVTGIRALYRRFSGGRVVPFGDGFIGISLVLPHRAALFSDDPLALAPYQVPNRYVRGILEGCKHINVAAFYPGRDFITVGRRVLGLVSFETDASGALLFEAIVSNHRDFSVLPDLLNAVDPNGVITAEFLTPNDTTSLARELGVGLTIEEVADMVRRGFEAQFNLVCDSHELSAIEKQAIAAVAPAYGDDRWLSERHLRPELTHFALERTQLGVFEARFELEQQRFIKEIVFSGDFIANSVGIERLESELRLCPAEWHAIDAVASDIFAKPENYILGIGRTHVIADTIGKGL